MASIERFIEGFKHFKEEEFEQKNEFYSDLIHNGQSPKVMMITCADSRISVQHLTHAKPGEIFVLRNVANLVPNFTEGDINVSTTSAIEFAVCYLKVESIVVMGHSFCGGIKYLMQSQQKTPPKDCSINNWVSTFTDARDKVLEMHDEKAFDDQCQECEKLAVLSSIENLKEYPWIKDALIKGNLTLHPWYYDMGKGELSHIEDDGALRPLLASNND